MLIVVIAALDNNGRVLFAVELETDRALVVQRFLLLRLQLLLVLRLLLLLLLFLLVVSVEHFEHEGVDFEVEGDELVH